MITGSIKMVKLFLTILPVAALAIMTSGCSDFFSTTSVGMLVKVTVLENGVERSGSGVWKSMVTNNIGIPDVPAHSVQEADAIPVRLANGRVFLLLPEFWGDLGSLKDTPLHSPNFSQIPMRLFYSDNPSLRDNTELSQDPARRNGAIGSQLGKVRYPQCDVGGVSKPKITKEPSVAAEPICFRTAIAEGTKSLEQVHMLAPDCPYVTPQCGVRIKSISITITDADTTRQMSAVFPWIKDYYEENGDIKVNEIHLPHRALRLLRT